MKMKTIYVWALWSAVCFWACFLLIFCGLLIWMYLAEIKLVTTASVPVGLYKLTHEPLVKGQYVVVCLPTEIAQFGRARGYIKAGMCQDGTQPAIKKVWAVSGDVVEITHDAVTVNGQRLPHSAQQQEDSRGRALPQIAVSGATVEDGKVWLFSFYDWRSWDSRYYGPLPVESVKATAKPVFVYGEDR